MEKVSKVVEINSEYSEMVLETLSNGVVRYDLEEISEGCTDTAQEVLDMGDIGSYIDAYSTYNNRVKNDFVGIYQVELNSTAGFQRFSSMLSDFRWNNPELKIPAVTFVEWQTNKIEVEKNRIMKLGKFLKSKKVEQSIIDFYSQQPKIDSKTYYLVISDRPQDIAGMSYYAKNWSSCQDTEGNVEYNSALGGSLHDNKLFIAYLVEDIEDVENLEKSMLARVNMRYATVFDTECLLPSRIYGTNETQQLMQQALKLVEEKHILSKDEKENYSELSYRVTEEVDSTVTIELYDEIYVEIDEYEYVTYDCPLCQGSGEYTVYSHRFDKDFDITCPHCNGDGEKEEEVNIHVSEYVDIQDEMDSKSYTDDYRLTSGFMEMNLNAHALIAHFDKFPIDSTEYVQWKTTVENHVEIEEDDELEDIEID